MSDTYKSLMKAVIAAMKADSAVGAVIADRVYSKVPQNEVFPYALIAISSSPFDAKDFSGQDHVIQINMYSRKSDPSQIADLKIACYNLLHRQESALTLDTGTMSILQFDGVSEVFIGTDGTTWEGVTQFRAVVTQEINFMTTGYSGRLITVAIGDGGGPETFTTIAALRDTTITESEQSVDTTSKDDGGKRSLLSGSILHSITISGTGVFTDSATLADIRTALRAGTHDNYEIEVIESSTNAGETLTGSFRVTNLEFAGNHDGEANYSLTLESDGTITAS